MDTELYLQRINYAGSKEPDLELLKQLQLCHLLTIPFENLSIHIKEPIVLQYELLFDKIVRKRRGGFCYELNGLFSALLNRLGFNSVMLPAGVANNEGEFTFIVSGAGNQLMLKCDMKIQQTIFPSNDYPDLKKFYEMVVSKMAEQVVLSKV